MASVAKKVLVLVVASVIAVVLLEVAASQLYARFKHRPFSRDEIRARLLTGPSAEPDTAPAAAAADPRVADQRVIIHPYFGYVASPTTPRANKYGFFGQEPMATRGPDVALVAVFGGSVADQLVERGGDVLRDALAERAPYQGRRVELINLALGGYKQPQQLLVLATLLALGAQFDAVINLDGFNEIDGAKDNLQDGVNPFFPYTWNLHARQVLDRTAMLHVATAELIRSRREDLRQRFARWPVTQSVFLLTLWDFLDQREEAALRAETAALHTALAQSATTPQQTGPPIRFVDDESMYLEYAEVWARASLEMSILCSGYGIRYAHFLQPNQYLPGSKTLTDEERANAYDQDVADTKRVATAYPIFSARGRDLRRQGVDFFDLTRLFEDESRTVYADTCCHLNDLGNQQLAEEIARAISDEVEAPAPTPSGEEEATPADEEPAAADAETTPSEQPPPAEEETPVAGDQAAR
jgi:hypothetical protein